MEYHSNEILLSTLLIEIEKKKKHNINVFSFGALGLGLTFDFSHQRTLISDFSLLSPPIEQYTRRKKTEGLYIGDAH